MSSAPTVMVVGGRIAARGHDLRRDLAGDGAELPLEAAHAGLAGVLG